MTIVDNAPDWSSEAPLKARQAIILAAEAAAYGRGDVALNVVLDADVDPAWLRIVAVRTLAALAVGPHAAKLWSTLRDGAHRLAVETGANDRNVRAALVVIALAESFERGALGRCEQLAQSSEFRDLDLAYTASLLCGHVVFLLAGADTSEVFARLRYRNGLEAP